MTEQVKKDEEKKGPEPGTVVGEDKDKGVIYVVHPVTKEQKSKLMKKGKIIDAKFKP